MVMPPLSDTATLDQVTYSGAVAQCPARRADALLLFVVGLVLAGGGLDVWAAVGRGVDALAEARARAAF